METQHLLDLKYWGIRKDQMFISSPGGQNHLKTTELQEATKSAPVPEREKKRHQYLFQCGKVIKICVCYGF